MLIIRVYMLLHILQSVIYNMMTNARLNTTKQDPNDRQLAGLVTAFHTDIVAFANGILHDPYQSEDVVQDAYIRFQNKVNAQYSSELSAKGYLYRIVRNLAIDCLRRKNYERRLFPEDIANIAEKISDNKSSLDDALIASDELVRVLAGLDKLPERTRIAFEMHRFGGYTMQKIAEHFAISKSMATCLVADGLVMCRRARTQYDQAEYRSANKD